MTSVKQIFGYKQQLLLLLCLAFALNVNTLFNDYALDDAMSITQNRFVGKGISGIPDILKTDLMAGFTGQTALATQVRYRPLPLVLLAVEIHFFGLNPMPAHGVNVILFLLITGILLYLLQHYLLAGKGYLAFLTVLLFIFHPVHTEVIANIKSGDELLTVLFLLLSLLSAIRYWERKKNVSLVMSLVCYFLALLCRETAVTFIAFVPLTLFYFTNSSVKTALVRTIPYAGVFVVFLLLRFAVVGMHTQDVKDVSLAPFLLA
ncbi:MAG TPA: hypothetical protein VNZ86_18790, partial [Bacteroidia bacterium]|nr:hypothetical protein [Bacteroidia bacterium]